MIRNCEDVKTLNDFHDCFWLCDKLAKIGLIETSRMIRWGESTIVNPEMIARLSGRIEK